LIAEALRQWLPKVIQAVQPWFSDLDMGKGSMWSKEISAKMSEAAIGIVCLTRENLGLSWIHFEAGALHKALDGGKVCTFLLGIQATDVDWPLAMFQHTTPQKEEVRKLVHTVNRTQVSQAILDKAALDVSFERWWPDLEQALDQILSVNLQVPPARSDSAKINELLDMVRWMCKFIGTPEDIARWASEQEDDTLRSWAKGILPESTNE
jgi:hypothetical protein